MSLETSYNRGQLRKVWTLYIDQFLYSFAKVIILRNEGVFSKKV